MERKYKITIPKPCHEDWNKMSPDINGRFCSSCAKNVVDFTTMQPDEIQVYIQQNSNICGRFKNTQLDSLTVQIPNHILYSQTQYQKMFILALFIAMGSTLFSCADKNGNKQKIDKIEIVEDSTENKNITVGIVLPSKLNKTTNPILPPPPPPKVDQVKFIKKQSQDSHIHSVSTGEIVLEPIIDSSKTKNK